MKSTQYRPAGHLKTSKIKKFC